MYTKHAVCLIESVVVAISCISGLWYVTLAQTHPYRHVHVLAYLLHCLSRDVTKHCIATIEPYSYIVGAKIVGRPICHWTAAVSEERERRQKPVNATVIGEINGTVLLML